MANGMGIAVFALPKVSSNACPKQRRNMTGEKNPATSETISMGLLVVSSIRCANVKRWFSSRVVPARYDDCSCVFQGGKAVRGMDRITGVGLYGRWISRTHLEFEVWHFTVIGVRAKNDARH